MYEFLLDTNAVEIKNRAREFAKSVPKKLILDMDAERVQYPTDFVKSLSDAKLLGVRFPKQWGGQGLNWKAEVAVLEEIGVLSMALSCLYSLPSICGEAINVFGNDEQRQKYLKPIMEGKRFCAEALTEPRGGSDFFGATTTAVDKGDHYLLNGQKRFVVGAEGADTFLVYAKTDPQAPPHKSISLFIVEKDFGVVSKYVYGLMGTRGGGAGRLFLKDVKVPKENIIGKPGDGGKIFYQMMYPERMTSAAGVLGMADSALRLAVEYAHKRKAFGKTIKNYQGVSFQLADSILLLDAARAIVYQAAAALDSNQDPGLCRRMVSEAKRFATESAWDILNKSMQVLGGIGYSNVYPLERLLRDVRLASIWTGTSEIMNLIIQHEYFTEVLESKNPPRNIEPDAEEADAIDEKIYE